jgi:hypothetical protein
MDQTVGNEMAKISRLMFQGDATALTLGKLVE